MYNDTSTTISAIVSIAITIVTLVAMWKMFEKAGQAGWKSIIPFYNLYIEFKFVWGSGWWFLLLLIPLVDIVVYFIHQYRLVKVFGGGIGMFILMLFLPTIATLILGLGEAKYTCVYGKSE